MSTHLSNSSWIGFTLFDKVQAVTDDQVCISGLNVVPPGEPVVLGDMAGYRQRSRNSVHFALQVQFYLQHRQIVE